MDMNVVEVSKNRTSDFAVLHELTRKELIADLIFDELYKGIQLTTNNKPDFNCYKLNEDYLLNLLQKYNQDAYENRLIALADEKAKIIEEDK